MTREKVFASVLLLAAVALYLAHGASFGVCLQDDAFISLRYARNLAEGHGLVYNPGERVEGYTNFLWTVLSAFPYLLGLDGPGFLRGMGFASGILALLAAAWLARELAPGEPAAAGVAAVLAAAAPWLVSESVMGLETAFFAALAVAGVAARLRERRLPSAFPWSGVLFALAALTRPEGMLVAGLVGLADLAERWTRRREGGPFLGRRFFLRWALFALPVAGHLAFRVAYYHDIVPNTFHAKVGGGWRAVVRGLGYAGDFALHSWPLLLAVLLGVAFLVRGEGGEGRDRWRLLPLGIALVYVLYVVKVGGDYKPTYRFFATPTLFLVPYAGAGIATLARRAGALREVALGGLLLLAAGGTLALGGPTRAFVAWRAEVLPVHRAAGRWLGEAFPPDAWLATGNAGVLPYESRLPTIDMYGLCDRHIALREMPRMGEGPPGHEKGDGKYVLDRKPRIILVMRARFSDHPLTWEEVRALRLSVSEREIFADPRFRREYELRHRRLPGFWFNWFERVADEKAAGEER